MKTKRQLADLILANARQEATEILAHAKGVAKFVMENFPDQVPDKFVRGEMRNESALFGRLRNPLVTGNLKLERLKMMTKRGVSR